MSLPPVNKRARTQTLNAIKSWGLTPEEAVNKPLKDLLRMRGVGPAGILELSRMFYMKI